jgi:uncharacterized protein YkwD
MPSVLTVTLVLTLALGLAGIASGIYILASRAPVSQSGPNLALPSSPEAITSDAASASPVAPSEVPPSLPATVAMATAPTTTATLSKAPASAKHSPAAAARTTSTTTSGGNATSYEQQVLATTNTQRTAAGCKALAWNSKLAAAARAHSQDMAAKNYFDHNSLDGTTPAQRVTAAGYTYRQFAENIAAGQATPTVVMATWMNSAGHKANILNCALTELGVGFATGGTYGTYWTQDFGTR